MFTDPRLCAAIVDRLTFGDNIIEIGGPEYMTLEDTIRTVMRVSGVSRTILSMPPYLLRLFLH